MSNCLALILLCLLLSGCVRSSASRLTLGANHRTGTFETSGSTEALDPLPRARSGWGTTVVVAPVDGIAHDPTRSLSAPGRKGDHPRVYGLMPTAETAMDGQGYSWGHAVLQTTGELGASIFDLVDPMIIWYQSTTPQWSPQRVWKRSGVDNAWSSGSNGEEREGGTSH